MLEMLILIIMMHMIAKKMTDKEIQAVAYHISMMKKK